MDLEALRSALHGEGLSLAVLFGSRATGREHPQSDWDIGVVADAAGSPDLDALAARLEARLGGRVDIVNLRLASPLLCMEVVRHGRVLLDATGDAFPAFASLSLRRYEDTRKLP